MHLKIYKIFIEVLIYGTKHFEKYKLTLTYYEEFWFSQLKMYQYLKELFEDVSDFIKIKTDS